MKAKSFHCSKSGVCQPVAGELGIMLKCVSDKMPPAYPCESEKIVYIGIEMNGKAPVQVSDFCKNLTKDRTRNVAFYIINGSGNVTGLESVIDNMKSNGVNTCSDILHINAKSGLFKKGQVTNADIETAKKWALKLADECN